MGRRKNINEQKLRDENSSLYVRTSKHLVSLGTQCEARSGKGDLEGELRPVTAANCLVEKLGLCPVDSGKTLMGFTQNNEQVIFILQWFLCR